MKKTKSALSYQQLTGFSFDDEEEKMQKTKKKLFEIKD